jgi:hypothetical protein
MALHVFFTRERLAPARRNARASKTVTTVATPLRHAGNGLGRTFPP